MSAKSPPWTDASSDGSNIENRIFSVMFNEYLANPPTITEKLAVPQAPKKAAKIVEDHKNDAREFLRNWQASWDKGE